MLHSWLCSNICQSLFTRRTRRNNKHSANTIRHTHFVMEVSTLRPIYCTVYTIFCALCIHNHVLYILHIVDSRQLGDSNANDYFERIFFFHLYLQFAVSFQIRNCNYFYYYFKLENEILSIVIILHLLI